MKYAIHSHRDLIVWQKAIELVVLFYQLTEDFPKHELYGLTSQMRRAAVSIPCNIAEGRKRGTRKDFRHFYLLPMALGRNWRRRLKLPKDFLSVGQKCVNKHLNCSMK